MVVAQWEEGDQEWFVGDRKSVVEISGVSHTSWSRGIKG